MSDIVDWLRARANLYETMHAQPDWSIGMRNAAAEIDRLRAEVERLTAECAERDWLFNEGGEESVAAIVEERDILRATNERLVAELCWIKSKCDDVMAEDAGTPPEELTGYSRGAHFMARCIEEHARAAILAALKAWKGMGIEVGNIVLPLTEGKGHDR